MIKINGVDLDETEVREQVGGVDRGETVIRIYYSTLCDKRNLFSIIEKNYPLRPRIGHILLNHLTRWFNGQHINFTVYF